MPFQPPKPDASSSAWSSITHPSTPAGSTWSKSRSASCAANAWTAVSTTKSASSPKSTRGNNSATPIRPKSTGCSQPRRPAKNSAGPTRSTSHNHCATVLVLNPNLAWAWLYSGWAKVYLGEPQAAIECEARARRLSPQDSQVFLMHTATAAAHYFAGRYAEASSWAEEPLRENPDYLGALRYLAASYAMTGRQEQAQKVMARLRELD